MSMRGFAPSIHAVVYLFVPLTSQACSRRPVVLAGLSDCHRQLLSLFVPPTPRLHFCHTTAHSNSIDSQVQPVVKSMSTSSDQEPLTNNIAELDLTSIEKFATKAGDALFGFIESSQARSSASDDDISFGNFLDAGTGSHSLRWMASIIHRRKILTNVDYGDAAAPMVSLKRFTAITADENMRRRVVQEAESLGISDRGDIIIGNWSNGVDKNGNLEFDKSNLLLEGKQFDTILADYLVGAMDGFSPYFQDLIFERLVPHLAPGGRLYIIGLQPIPDAVTGDANIMCKITKIRDSCILLANHRCYREYPVDWVERHLRRAGLDVVETRQYPIRYDHATMLRQINVGRSKLGLFPSKGMADEMRAILDRLEHESLEVTKKQVNSRISLGFDYVVVAERPKKIVNHQL